MKPGVKMNFPKLVIILVILAVTSECLGKSSGRRHRTFHERIVGGDVVARGSLPYQVSLQWYGDHFCGGSILTPNVVLTAAHCLYDYEDEPYVIAAGEHSLTLKDGTEQFRYASHLVIHEGYDDWTFENDVALMWVDPPFVFNEYVRGIPLPPIRHNASGPAPVSGWGTTAEGGELSDVLRVVTLDIISDEQCRAEIPGDPSDIYDSMICAYYQPGGKDSCQGDSGGPLTANDTGSVYVAGIVSWGWGCARAGVPGMYTEVSYFSEWITANIQAYKPHGI